MDRVFPKPDAADRDMLTGWLEWQRATVPRKAAGLDDAEAYRSLIKTSPQMTVAGVVSHLRWTEWGWFAHSFPSLAGSAQTPPQDESGWAMATQPPLEQLISEYEQQCETSRSIVAALDLATMQEFTPAQFSPVSVRWIVTHMIDETARHLGHLDLLREMLDGTRSY